MPNYWSTNTLPNFSGYIGIESFWMPPDTQERFQKDPREGYTETSIVYRHNSNGFRTKEFDLGSGTPSILCLGDSFTYGVGVKEQDTWPSKIAEIFPQYTVYNLGIPGAAWDTITRFLVNVGNLLDTKIVLIFWPEIFRYELYHENEIRQLTSQDEKAFPPGTLVDWHFENLASKNRLVVEILSKINGYKIFETTVGKFSQVVDLGRDNHYGPKTYENLSNYFAEMIKNDPCL